MFKFIHTADIHLDSPLRGLSRYEGAPVDLLRNATRQAFTKLLDIALEEKVSFVIIAGDLYDGDWRDFNTGLFFVSEMNRLRQKGIRCFLLSGNHDAESQLTKNLPLPDNVSVFGSRTAETFTVDDIHVVLHGQSFKQRDIFENLAGDYPDPISGAFNIGVLHTGLEGYAAHAKYAPCTLNQLKAKGYDYWALGHIHQREVLNEMPHIIFPGNLQGRHIGEQGAKGAALVSVKDGSVAEIDWVYPDVVRWIFVEIDLTSCHSREEALGIFEETVQAVVEQEAEGRTLAARLLFTISAELHHALMQEETLFLAELQSLALGNHGEALWIEKVRFHVAPPREQVFQAVHHDAVSELQDMLAQAADDPDLMNKISKDLEVLVSRLPAEIRANPDLELVNYLKEKKPEKLIEEVTPFLVSSLLEFRRH